MQTFPFPANPPSARVFSVVRAGVSTCSAQFSDQAFLSLGLNLFVKLCPKRMATALAFLVLFRAVGRPTTPWLPFTLRVGKPHPCSTDDKTEMAGRPILPSRRQSPKADIKAVSSPPHLFLQDVLDTS